MINFLEKLFPVSIVGLFVGIFLMADVFSWENNVVCMVGYVIFVLSLASLILISLGYHYGVGGFICGLLLSISVCCLFTALIMGAVSWLPYDSTAHTILFCIGIPLIIVGGGSTSTVIFIIHIRRR